MSTSCVIDKHCDTATTAVQRELDAIKSIIAKHEAEQTERLSSIEKIVASLRMEKEQLQNTVSELMDTLHDLGNDITEDAVEERQFLTQVYTTVAGDGGGGASSTSMVPNEEDKISEVAEVAHEEGSFDIFAEDSQETFFETQAMMETQPADEVAEDSITAAPGTTWQQQQDAAPREDDAVVEAQPIKKFKPVVEEEAEDTITALVLFRREETDLEDESDMMETRHPAVEEEEAEDSTASGLQQQNTDPEEEQVGAFLETQVGSFSIDTMSASATSSSTNHKRRRFSKAYKSPKKWRRMMRSHRLKSILLAN